MSRIILVSNRLPVAISIHPDGSLEASRTDGGLATALSALFAQQDSAWIGWTGLSRSLTTAQLASADLPEGIFPINLSHQQVSRFYERYSNGVLWPLLHGVPAKVTLEPEDFHALQIVLHRFADAVVKIARPDDVIWIHDYLLMLLPGLLRHYELPNRIGFFLHTPFMSTQFKSELPMTEELVRSLQKVDVLGVQVARDVAAANDWGLTAQSYPIGVDFDKFEKLAKRKDAVVGYNKLRQKYPDKQIIVSLSRLDYSKGILTQLDAIAKLATLRQDFVYRLNVAPSRETVLGYGELHDAIVTRVNEINALHPVIDFTYLNLNELRVVSLLMAADVQLNIPIKDGMNLVAKEHVAIRREPAVIVLSREAGAADQLTEALIVPPTDLEAITSSLHQALDMSADEKSRRWRALRRGVKHDNIQRWYESFMADLTTKPETSSFNSPRK